jgi:hypothetical protein
MVQPTALVLLVNLAVVAAHAARAPGLTPEEQELLSANGLQLTIPKGFQRVAPATGAAAKYDIALKSAATGIEVRYVVQSSMSGPRGEFLTFGEVAFEMVNAIAIAEGAKISVIGGPPSPEDMAVFGTMSVMWSPEFVPKAVGWATFQHCRAIIISRREVTALIFVLYDDVAAQKKLQSVLDTTLRFGAKP